MPTRVAAKSMAKIALFRQDILFISYGVELFPLLPGKM